MADAEVGPERKNISGGEKRVKNADFMNVAGISVHKFPENTKLYLSTNDYTGEFEVTEARVEQGTEFRRIFGGRGEDVVVDLSYLQSEFARGNVKLVEEGKIIDVDPSSSGKAV